MCWKFTLYFFDTTAAGKHGSQSTPFVSTLKKYMGQTLAMNDVVLSCSCKFLFFGLCNCNYKQQLEILLALEMSSVSVWKNYANMNTCFQNCFMGGKPKMGVICRVSIGLVQKHFIILEVDDLSLIEHIQFKGSFP